MAPTIISERKTKPRKHFKLPEAVMRRAFAQSDQVKAGLQVLISSGISRTNIAAELGVSRRQLWEWESGRYQPQNPLLAFIIIYWAEHVRDLRNWIEFEEKVKASREAR